MSKTKIENFSNTMDEEACMELQLDQPYKTTVSRRQLSNTQKEIFKTDPCMEMAKVDTGI